MTRELAGQEAGRKTAVPPAPIVNKERRIVGSEEDAEGRFRNAAYQQTRRRSLSLVCSHWAIRLHFIGCLFANIATIRSPLFTSP